KRIVLGRPAGHRFDREIDAQTARLALVSNPITRSGSAGRTALVQALGSPMNAARDQCELTAIAGAESHFEQRLMVSEYEEAATGLHRPGDEGPFQRAKEGPPEEANR